MGYIEFRLIGIHSFRQKLPRWCRFIRSCSSNCFPRCLLILIEFEISFDWLFMSRVSLSRLVNYYWIPKYFWEILFFNKEHNENIIYELKKFYLHLSRIFIFIFFIKTPRKRYIYKRFFLEKKNPRNLPRNQPRHTYRSLNYGYLCIYAKFEYTYDYYIWGMKQISA